MQMTPPAEPISPTSVSRTRTRKRVTRAENNSDLSDDSPDGFSQTNETNVRFRREEEVDGGIRTGVPGIETETSGGQK